jgi:hypothetical protein
VRGIGKWALSTLVLLGSLLTIFPAPTPAQETRARTDSPATQPSMLWAQLSRIVSSRGSGYQPPVAVSGETIVISGLFGIDGSLAYVYVKPASGWTNMQLAAHLRVGGGVPIVGGAVSIDGDTIVVSSSPDACPRFCQAKGSLYVFVKPPAGWSDMTPTAVLQPSDLVSGEYLTVFLSGNTVVAGNPYANANTGEAYVFVRPPGGWANMTETAKLTASNGAANDELGSSVAVDGDTVVTGAPVSSAYQGRAYIFAKPPGGWKNETQTAELKASDGQPRDYLGSSVAIQGGTAVVGAPQNYTGNPGVAYVFVQPSAGWSNMTQTGKLTAADSLGDSQFGVAVGISNNIIFVGAPYYYRRGNVRGAVFVFAEPKAGWSDMSSKLVMFASDGRWSGGLGLFLGASGNIVAATAPYFSFEPSPHVYIFQIPVRQ